MTSSGKGHMDIVGKEQETRSGIGMWLCCWTDVSRNAEKNLQCAWHFVTDSYTHSNSYTPISVFLHALYFLCKTVKLYIVNGCNGGTDIGIKLLPWVYELVTVWCGFFPAFHDTSAQQHSTQLHANVWPRFCSFYTILICPFHLPLFLLAFSLSLQYVHLHSIIMNAFLICYGFSKNTMPGGFWSRPGIANLSGALLHHKDASVQCRSTLAVWQIETHPTALSTQSVCTRHLEAHAQYSFLHPVHTISWKEYYCTWASRRPRSRV